MGSCRARPSFGADTPRPPRSKMGRTSRGGCAPEARIGERNARPENAACLTQQRFGCLLLTRRVGGGSAVALPQPSASASFCPGICAAYRPRPCYDMISPPVLSCSSAFRCCAESTSPMVRHERKTVPKSLSPGESVLRT